MTLSYEANKEQVFKKLNVVKTKQWLEGIRLKAELVTDLKSQIEILDSEYDNDRYNVPCGISTTIRSGAISSPTEIAAINIRRRQDKRRESLEGRLRALQNDIYYARRRLLFYEFNHHISKIEKMLLEDFYCDHKTLDDLMVKYDVTMRTIEYWKTGAIERISV